MSQASSANLSGATPNGAGGYAPAGPSASASASEKIATASPTSPGAALLAAPGSAPPPKRRSCVTCRSRKVRCDKLSPCSNCRRAKIACIFPSGDRPPRWARRLERQNQEQQPDAPQEGGEGVGQVMERLRNLEALVKDLSGQLENANATAARSGSAPGGPSSVSSQVNSPGSSASGPDLDRHRDDPPATASVQKQFGRLVLQDANKSRYVSSGFWSRVNDEIKDLKMDTEGLDDDDSDFSEDEDSPGKSLSTQELDRNPVDRHAFLFHRNGGSSGPDLDELRPLPSQIPFLLTVFTESVHSVVQVVHIPTVQNMIRDHRNSGAPLAPADEALMFAIYYASLTSMEEDDVIKNFGTSKANLNLQYRLGVELALAKADFLNLPELALVQALLIFLFLVRRHDSPRYVWMMTGLVIRMGQALGLQRDGSHFPLLTPYEVESRRKTWWALCMLDLRSSEDQGTDLTITLNMFDTKMPLNINDADISPETKETPPEREGITDMTFTLISCRTSELMRRLITPDLKDGMPALEEHSKTLEQIYETWHEGYIQYTSPSTDILAWIGMNVSRLVIGKMTLILYLPVLFSSPSEEFSADLRTKLFISAIEVAEYNHALNAEPAARRWRWIYQTYTHWYAIVFLLIEISRRDYSPTVERAWVALHSSWLIPRQSSMNKNLRVWLPLRKLMLSARKHRDAEIERLRNNSQAARQVELEDMNTPHPQSSGPVSVTAGVELFRDRWRKLVGLAYADHPAGSTATSNAVSPFPGGAANAEYTTQPVFSPTTAYDQMGANFSPSFAPTPAYDRTPNPGSQGFAPAHLDPAITVAGMGSASMTGNPFDPSYDTFNASSADFSGGQTLGSSFTPWLWADADPSVDVFANMSATDADFDMNMDVDLGMDWQNWVETAKGAETQWSAEGGGDRSRRS